MSKKWNWDLQFFADEEEENKGSAEDSKEEVEGAKTENKDSKESSEEKTFSQAEVNEMLEKRIARERAKLKAEQEEEAKKAKMDAEEKAKYELEKSKERIEELEKAKKKMELSRGAASLLKEKDIDADDDLLDFIVAEDEEETEKRIDKFVSVVEAVLQKREIERATGKTPKSTNTQTEKISELQKRINKYSN